MRGRTDPRLRALLAGAALSALLLLGLAFDPSGASDLWRERTFDFLLAAAPPRPLFPSPPIAVIDIDDASLAKLGPWPWRRERLARLVEAARVAGAAAIGVDILCAEPDALSPAALARRLAAVTGDAHVADMAASLPDDDQIFAQALKAGRVALGFALDPDGQAEAASTPVMTRGALATGDLWAGAGGVFPDPELLKSGVALGALSLPGDSDGVVRRAPLFVLTGETLRPGLALETLRLARGASAYLLNPAARRIASGKLSAFLPPDGLLRLAPGGEAIPRYSAAQVLEQGLGSLPGGVVFIGASAPEAGGLRATSDDPLTPSVLIQAQAARQIAQGVSPAPLDPRAELGLALAAAALLVGAAALAAPALSAAAALALILALAGGALLAASRGLLIDPVQAGAPALAGFAAARAIVATAARRRAQRLRARFERRLPPELIAIMVADEGAAKLDGERREITALFTDVEGFTSMVGRSEPEALVRALDNYFDGVTRIVLAHGGMIDKFVGDAVHAFFNMPLDLADHATRALDCAVEIARWTEARRREPAEAAMGFGRTRIGMESGPALVGDVGGGFKLDYTAHGDTVNAAARLEAANKVLGTSIAVGPGATALIASDRLRPVGMIELRGFPAPLAVASPWPEAASVEWRARYRAAFARMQSEPEAARAEFAELAGEYDDAVSRRLGA